MMLYFMDASLKALLKKTIGCLHTSIFLSKRTVAIVCLDAKEKIIKSFVKLGLIKTGGLLKLTLLH